MRRPHTILVLVTNLALLGVGISGAQGLPSASPTSVGLSAAGLARLDSAMTALIAEKELPGVVVASRQFVAWRTSEPSATGSWIRRIRWSGPIFRLYSMTKAIVSADS
jgi:hypothetical protein